MADQQATEIQGDKLAARNPAIEAILFGSHLAVEVEFGFKCLNQYLTDLALLSNGAHYSDLGIEERRRACDPAMLINENGKMLLVEDRGLIRNSSLTPPGSVAVLRITGFMQTESSGGSSGIRGMRGLASDLRMAYQNPNVAGILLEVNSGGGEILSMEVVNSALAARNKPVLAHAYFAASAAYGVSAATDEIVMLSDFSRVGSIGAVISINKVALQEYTDAWVDIYGKNAPDKNGEFRKLQNGDFSAIQQVADDATDKFQAQVAGLRILKGTEAKIKETLSGGVFTGAEAKRRGLADGIGGLEYVTRRLEAWTKNPRYAGKNA